MKYRIVQTLEDNRYRIQQSDKSLFSSWKFMYNEVYDKLEMAQNRLKALRAVEEAKDVKMKFIVVPEVTNSKMSV